MLGAEGDFDAYRSRTCCDIGYLPESQCAGHRPNMRCRSRREGVARPGKSSIRGAVQGTQAECVSCHWARSWSTGEPTLRRESPERVCWGLPFMYAVVRV